MQAVVNFSQGQKSRSNVTKIQSLLPWATKTHIPTELHQFLFCSSYVFARTKKQNTRSDKTKTTQNNLCV